MMTYGEKIELEEKLRTALFNNDQKAVEEISKKLRIEPPKDKYDLTLVPHCC